MTKKKRIPISTELSDEILFLSDRTCCICNDRSKSVQTHHIDENPANNEIKNLAVLCLECHNKTMITGGFGRQLTPGQVTKYRDEWLARVVKRKADADKLASIKMVTGHTINEDKEPSLENRDGTDAEGTTPSHDDDFEYEKEKKTELLKNYLMNILLINQAHQSICQAKMDGGTTADMLNGSYALSDFYEKVLIELSQFYTAGHFDKPTPERYFRELVSSRYVWHGLSIEPFGKSGCMVERAMAISAAMSDMEDMIFSMVGSLVGLLGYNIKEGFDFETWRKEWKKKRASRG